MTSKLTSLFNRTPLLLIFGILALIIGLGFLANHITPFLFLGAIVAIGVVLVIIGKPWYGFLLLVFFLPFERIGSYDIAGVTVRPSQVIALFTFFALFTEYARRQRTTVAPNPIVLPLLGFIIVSLFSLLNAPNLQRSILVLGFIVFISSLSILVPLLLRTKKQLSTFLRIMTLSFFLVCAFGLFQFVGDWIGLPQSLTGLRDLYTKEVLGFPRVQSTALEPLYFANYLLLPLSLLLVLFLSRDRTFKLPHLLALLGLGGLNLLLTVARGGYIAFACSAAVLAVFYFSKLWNLRNVLIGLAGAIIVAIAATQLMSFELIFAKFITHVTNLFTGASFSERVETFAIAIRAFELHPWIGIGAGSFGPFAAAHPYIMPSQGWKIVNNEYLELLAEHGILGFVSMISIWVIVIIRSIKALLRATDPFVKALLAGTLAAFLGILVQYNTFSILYITHIWFTIGVLIALQNMILKPKRS